MDLLLSLTPGNKIDRIRKNIDCEFVAAVLIGVNKIDC